MELTVLEILYIVLIVFLSVVWTLIVLILIRVYKILWPILEMADYYKRVKWFFGVYSQIPFIVKDVIKDSIFWKSKKMKK